MADRPNIPRAFPPGRAARTLTGRALQVDLDPAIDEERSRRQEEERIRRQIAAAGYSLAVQDGNAVPLPGIRLLTFPGLAVTAGAAREAIVAPGPATRLICDFWLGGDRGPQTVRKTVDLTRYTEARLQAQVEIVTAAATLAVEADTGSGFSAVAGLSVSIAATGIQDTGWVALPDGWEGDVTLRVHQSAGGADPTKDFDTDQIQGVFLQFR